MSFPIAMMVYGVLFLCGALGIYKILEFFGVRKFTNQAEKPKTKLH